ncbi:uncharacterized protein LOC126707452 isoform X2 [Quercus robur]|uniref:uncharacterized protein LOC126707452 isoform X2 n=1 Tax=Quercus robur TaxID=38942 RepID=UPI002163C5F9|nr:uncharacterized protein LOC126707452 isoform X2 [Quercus robur]
MLSISLSVSLLLSFSISLSLSVSLSFCCLVSLSLCCSVSLSLCCSCSQSPFHKLIKIHSPMRADPNRVVKWVPRRGTIRAARIASEKLLKVRALKVEQINKLGISGQMMAQNSK